MRTSESPGDGRSEHTGPRISGFKDQPSRRYEPDRDNKSPWPERRPPWAEIICFYCGKKGHTRNFCRKRKMDEAIAQEKAEKRGLGVSGALCSEG